jgi:hypothetical protein
LTGSGPFAAESAEESWDRARHCKLDRSALKNAGVPRVLERICLKALAGEPEQRYRSAAQLEHALAHYLRRRPIRLAALAAALFMLASALVLTYSRRAVPHPNSAVAAIDPVHSKLFPLQLLPVTLNIEHMAKRGEDGFEMRGNLGEQSFGVQACDDITIEARVAPPAYAYLIAYRPDGIDEICDPEDPDRMPAKSTSSRYPPSSKADRVYRLNDGSGLIAFALVVSRSPLPSYREWRKHVGTPPWRKGVSGASGVVWWDDGQRLAALAASGGGVERGSGARIRGGGAAVADLARWLRAVPGIDLVAVKAFQVSPAVEPVK